MCWCCTATPSTIVITSDLKQDSLWNVYEIGGSQDSPEQQPNSSLDPPGGTSGENEQESSALVPSG